MADANALIKRIVQTHESILSSIAGIRTINAFVLSLSRELARRYARSISVVRDMIGQMAMHGRNVQSLHVARLVGGIQPALETGTGESEGGVSLLESLRVFVSRRFTDVIPGIINRLRTELRRLRVPPYKRAVTTPSMPLAIQPQMLETIEAIGYHISRISDVRRKIYEASSATTRRIGVSYTQSTGTAFSPVGVFKKEVADILVRMTNRHAPSITSMSMLGYDLQRRAVNVHALGRRMADIYRSGASIARTPTILEASRISSGYGLNLLGLTGPWVGRIDRSAEPIAEEMMETPSFGVAEVSQIRRAIEAMETPKITSGTVLMPTGQFPSEMKEKYPMSPIEVPTHSLMDITKVASGYLAIALEMSQTSGGHAAGLRNLVTYRAGVEKAVRSTLGGVMSITSKVSLDRYALERVLLRGPLSVPTAKLQEIIPFLRSVSTQARAERHKPSQHTFNITIEDKSIDRGFGSRSAEVNLRELERRIARILREEARRYGINL